jgi:hypothetical protein
MVLLALAACVNDSRADGFLVWPSIARLSELTGIGESTVKLHLTRLVERGLLAKHERRRRANGTLGVWVYEVRYTRADPSAVDEPTRADPSALGQSRPIGSLEPVSTEPVTLSLILADEPASSPPPPAFAAFWSLYPRKTGKGDAERKWNALSAAQRQAAMDAIPNHVAHWRQTRIETRFIPHPATWLHHHRWDDDLGAPRTRGFVDEFGNRIIG